MNIKEMWGGNGGFLKVLGDGAGIDDGKMSFDRICDSMGNEIREGCVWMI
nr:hypothetical protein [Bacillus sp. WP8]